MVNKYNSRITRLSAAVAALALCGCAAEIAGEDGENGELPIGSAEESIIGGTSTSARTAIGQITGPLGPCTATLISSRVILTAAHCLAFQTDKSGIPSFDDTVSGSGIQFIMDGQPAINVTRFSVLSTNLGDSDIAVARLASDSTVTPITFAETLPMNGDPVTAWGYGCSSAQVLPTNFPCTIPPGGGSPLFCGFGGQCVANANQNVSPGGFCRSWVNSGTPVGDCTIPPGGGSPYACASGQVCVRNSNQDVSPGGKCYALPNTGGVKRSVATTWNATGKRTNAKVTCAGDSGGPILNSEGKIIALNSAGWANTPGGGEDTPANIVAHRGFVGRLRAVYGKRAVCTTCGLVSLRTYDGQHYVQATNGGGSTVNANPTWVGEWETFWVVPFTRPPATQLVGLQSRSGWWLKAIDGGGGVVSMDAEYVGDWEAFTMTGTGQSNTVNFSTMMTGNYLVAENGGGGAVNANRTYPGVWERFYLNGSVGLAD